VAQAVLRVSPADPDIQKSLLEAATKLFEIYDDAAEIYCHVTCNLVLLKQKTNEWAFYYGQRFGPTGRLTKEVFHGQEWQDGKRVKKAQTFTLNSPSDVAQIPTSFSEDQFAGLFHAAYPTSDVVVHSIANYCYIFQKGK
jgi:hypothetical protein